MISRNNNIFILVLFLLLTTSFLFSQNDKEVGYSSVPPQSGSAQKTKETAPVFILQGAVKLKGKPVNGVVLSVTKEGRQVSKIITPKNGLYYFQLKRSMTDPKSEYKLIILKDGIASGILRVNTYTPKEKFTSVPYMFSLDIALTPPSDNGNVVKKDFGRIKWVTEKNAFDFDKDYIPVIEPDARVVDSIKAAEKTKEDQELKRQADSIAEIMAADIKAESVKRKAAKEAAEKALAEKELAKQTNGKTSAKANKSGEVVSGKDLGKVTKSATGNKNLSSSESAKNIAAAEKTRNETAAEKAKNTTAEKIKLQQQTNAANVAKKNTVTANNTDAKQSAAVRQKNTADSIANSGTGQKDLFFLTGVPMEKFKKNLPVGDAYSRDTDGYDANETFISNSERNRLLAAKQRYERKKAENFAKKQETNNTLTSLMDVVEEYDKSKRK